MPLRIVPRRGETVFEVVVDCSGGPFRRDFVQVRIDARRADRRFPEPKPLMATPDVLDIDSLLRPLDGDNPCGESLRYDPLWDELSSARRGRRDAVVEDADEEPEWRVVRDLAAEALETRSKDLQIVGWLTDSLVRTNGFAGLRDGLRVLGGLVEQYWDALYPELDADDPEIRAAPLVWLTDPNAGARLPGALLDVPLAATNGDGVVYSLGYKLSLTPRPKKDNEESYEYEARTRELGEKAEKFRSAVQATPASFYEDLCEDLAACRALMDATERVLDEKLGLDFAPSWSGIRKTIEDFETSVAQICREQGIGQGSPAAADESGADDAGTASLASGGERTGGGPAGPPRTRVEAIARLREAADYFRTAEPHSPVSALVQRAVRWANLPFEKVLAELVRDDAALARVWETLGVTGPSEES